MGEVTPEERVQKVKANLLEDLDFEPEKIRNFYTTTIFGRALAHIVGWTGKKALMLRCTSAGELKTAPTSTGIEKYSVKPVEGADDWQGWDFDLGVVSRVDIFLFENTAEVRFKDSDGIVGDIFELPEGFYSVDMRTPSIQMKNKTAGQNIRGQVIGWK